MADNSSLSQRTEKLASLLGRRAGPAESAAPEPAPAPEPEPAPEPQAAATSASKTESLTEYFQALGLSDSAPIEETPAPAEPPRPEPEEMAAPEETAAPILAPAPETEPEPVIAMAPEPAPEPVPEPVIVADPPAPEAKPANALASRLSSLNSLVGRGASPAAEKPDEPVTEPEAPVQEDPVAVEPAVEEPIVAAAPEPEQHDPFAAPVFDDESGLPDTDIPDVAAFEDALPTRENQPEAADTGPEEGMVRVDFDFERSQLITQVAEQMQCSESDVVVTALDWYLDALYGDQSEAEQEQGAA